MSNNPIMFYGPWGVAAEFVFSDGTRERIKDLKAEEDRIGKLFMKQTGINYIPRSEFDQNWISYVKFVKGSGYDPRTFEHMHWGDQLQSVNAGFDQAYYNFIKQQIGKCQQQLAEGKARGKKWALWVNEGADNIPVVSNVKSAYEFGKGVYYGNLSAGEYVLAAGSIIFPQIKHVKKVPKLFNWGDKADEIIEESTKKVDLGKSSKAGDGLEAEGSGEVPNGNSKASTKPQHGYEISEKATGDVAKTGISGQPLNKNGT